MFLLIKEIAGEHVIIGSAQKTVSARSAEASRLTVYEISDNEFSTDMIYAKIESFDFVEEEETEVE